MTKVVTNPQNNKHEGMPICWTCSKPVVPSDETRSWYRFSFCCITCFDRFKDKFN